MSEKRKDSKGRILRDNEFQQKDGRYKYRFKDASGNLKTVYAWRLVDTDRTPAGKKHSESLRELEKQIARDLEDGIVVNRKLTLNDYWQENIELRVLKQSTRTNYKYMYNKYIKPVFGNVQMKDITYTAIKKFLKSLLRDGFKPNSVEIIYTILHPVFDDAVKDNLIRNNPSDKIMVDIKKGENWQQKKKHALTEDEQEAFIDFIANSETFSHWLPLFTCLLGTGCRIGEMLGLTWSDCDFTNGIININHNLIYRQQDSGKCEFHITTPKTTAGTRVIPMFQPVRKALMQEKLRQMQHGFCKTEIDGYKGFVFTNRYGEVMTPHNVNRAIERIYKEYNAQETALAEKENRKPVLIPHFSAHILRHTFCTRFCENETDLKLIQEIMGHADITTTMDIYNESNTARKQASFERLEGKIKIC